MVVLSHARRGSLPLASEWVILGSLPLFSRVIKSETTKRVTWASGVVAGCNLHRPFCFHALGGLARGEFNGPFVLRLFVAFYQKCGVIIGKWYRVKALSKFVKRLRERALSPFIWISSWPSFYFHLVSDFTQYFSKKKSFKEQP